MKIENLNLIFKFIFFLIGIIAFSMIILWLGNKLYPEIKRKIFGTPNSFNETRDVEDHSKNSSLIETLDETKVIYRKNSDTGIL